MALNAITVADLSVGDLPSEEVMQDQGRRAALAARRIVRRPVIDVDVIAGIQCRTSADGRLDAGKVTFIKSLVTDMATALGVAGAGPHPDPDRALRHGAAACTRRPGHDVDMFCASVAYPLDAEGFDFDYFRTRHAPMFAELLGENCVRFEVHRGLATPGAPPPPFVAAAYFWVTSAEAFGATLGEHAATVYSDIANFSQTQPVRGWAEVS